MKIKSLGYFCLLVVLVSASLTAKAQLIAKQQQYQLPVLPQKNTNPLFRLSLFNNSKQVKTLQQLNLSLNKGISELENIQCLDGGQDSTLLNTAAFTKLKVLAEMSVAKKKDIKLPLNMLLQPGENYLWIAVKLKPQAPMGKLISVVASTIVVDQQTVTVQSTNSAQQRVAVAVRQAGQENVKSHRIPGLATASDGTLLAIYDARYDVARDLQGHIDIGLSRSLD